MKLSLDEQRLKELLVDFYTLTKIRIVIFDNEFNEVIAYPEEPSEFCALVKSNPDMKLHCDECDREACRVSLSSGGLYIYKCHMGLTEAVAPIKLNDIIPGYIMLGQIADNKGKEEVLKRSKKYGVKNEGLARSLESLSYKDAEYIKAASKIMETCACYLWIAHLVSIDEGNLVFKLSSYIANNLREDLSVQKLCSVFMISRSRLYEISNKYFGMSIARHIRKKRIDYAASLLSENKCLVSEAADKAGFSDYNYFSKVFKRETGIVPNKFRADI